jgi:hypothetical protein
MARPTFQQACSRYVHRFTMEHVPAWARQPVEPGKFYAPQFRSDREWYEHTTFPGDAGHLGDRNHCFTSGQTWPLGEWLKAQYSPHVRGD